MRDNELIVKVQSSIGRQCYTHGYVALVDVLMDAGVLDSGWPKDSGTESGGRTEKKTS